MITLFMSWVAWNVDAPWWIWVAIALHFIYSVLRFYNENTTSF